MLPATLLLWAVLVAVRGGWMAAQVVGLVPAAEEPTELLTNASARAAYVVLGLCLMAALGARAWRPAATLPLTCAAGGLVVLAGAVAMSALGAVLMVALLFALAWLTGSTIVGRLNISGNGSDKTTNDAAIVRVPIAIGLGLGVLGLLFLLPAAVGQLTFTSVALLSGGLLLLLALDRGHLHAEWAALRGWRPPALCLTWCETILLGLTVGLVAFALLTSFVPEVQTDAMRQHLPIAREIWQSGSVDEFSPMNVSGRPMQGHLLYGVAYGLAGVSGAKLVQALVGLTAIAGVAGLGWLGAAPGAGRTGARTAGIVSAAIFATAPLVLWELGHAFLDLFPVLYAVTAALCILVWISRSQREGAAHCTWLVLAGALCGFGFAAKLNMGLLSVAFAAGIGLVGRGPWQWRERLLAVGAFGLGHLVIAPWLVRDWLIGGVLQSPKLFRQFSDIAPLDSAGLPHSAELAIAEEGGAPPARGFGRAPLDLLRGLWLATFRGGDLGFPIVGRGEIGIAPLLLAPLALLGPRGRATAFLAVAAAISYVGWWLTDFQIARHFLPTLALLAALGGMGLATAVSSATTPLRRTLGVAAQAGAVLACALAPVFFLASPRTQLPVALLLGRESATDYVLNEVPAATALLASSDALPPDTRVGYISIEWEGPQLYTEARLVYLSAHALGNTPEAVLTSLNELDISHFIWNRERTSAEQDQSVLLSTPFLRQHTRILAGDRNAYLFEVIPETGQVWGAQEPEPLLADPDLKRVRRSLGGAWEVEGKIEKRRGAVTLSARGAIRQRVPVDAGAPYLLSATTSCSEPLGRTELSFHWFDAQGAPLGNATEMVMPSVERSEPFLWRRAPDGAASVMVGVAAAKGSRCDVGRVELIALDPP